MRFGILTALESFIFEILYCRKMRKQKYIAETRVLIPKYQIRDVCLFGFWIICVVLLYSILFGSSIESIAEKEQERKKFVEIAEWIGAWCTMHLSHDIFQPKSIRTKIIVQVCVWLSQNKSNKNLKTALHDNKQASKQQKREHTTYRCTGERKKKKSPLSKS